ncbi:MAG TPA: SRPBCC domain-containing protein [Candidatus Nitrosopolaris sp.]|nr:SRPBCC domain-containing protein [Candidatus Nitrosopolaris sp.]
METRKRTKYMIAAGVVATAIVAGVMGWSKRKSKEVRTEIDIRASDERVWQILTDFPNFAKWNPFITKISGDLKKDAKLKVRIQPVGERTMTFRPIILNVEPKRELHWIGRLAVPGLFSGEHIFTIEPIGKDHVRFIHREIFTGLFVLIYASNFDTNIRQGFEEMNQALKAKAEQSTL